MTDAEFKELLDRAAKADGGEALRMQEIYRRLLTRTNETLELVRKIANKLEIKGD